MYGELAEINPFRYRTYYYDNETWFYYLQSRYYDPAIGRFINADGYTSTGQGFLGNNMFAYCLNNPVAYIDLYGSLASPFPSLIDYYYMHKAVQYDIAEQYGFGIEVYVVGPKGVGRLDLYDGYNNEYYEVKHEYAAYGDLVDTQMQKYDAAHVTGWRFSEYHMIGELSRGDMDIRGSTQYSYWDIKYEHIGDGIISYSWELNESRYQQSLATLATATSVAFVVYFYGNGGGYTNGLVDRDFHVR